MAGCVSGTDKPKRLVTPLRALSGAAALLLPALLVARSPAPPVEAVRAGPTIVSLNPCADAILAEVADPSQIVAISHYSADPRSSSMPPEQARQFPITRGTVEEVVTLHPDLVVDGSFTAPATMSAYARLGLRVETVGTVNSVDDARAQVRRLATLSGHPDRGEALVARIDAALAAAAPRPGARPLRAVMWESGGMVPGDRTLIADLLRRTGFANASAARGYAQADILPLERLLADPPQVILTAADGEGQGADVDRMLSHPALAALHGVHRDRFASNLLYCGGPTIVRAARRLAEIRDDAQIDSNRVTVSFADQAARRP